jgi:hypothetical protein
VIDLSEVPVLGEARLIPVADWDRIIDTLAVAAERGAANPSLLREALSDAFAGFGNQVYRCPRCGELVVMDRATGAAEFFTPHRSSA